MNALPRKLKFIFASQENECVTAQEAGLGGKENGELLSLAEGHFDVFITIDKNIRYQQNISGRNIAILIIRAPSNDVIDIQPRVPDCLLALKSIRPGEIVEVGH